MSKRSIGLNYSFQRTKNENGTASYFEASAKQVATEDVSYCPVCLLKQYTDISTPTALYEADRNAHEEAVQNGGVRFFHLIQHQVLALNKKQLILYWYGIPHEVTGLNLATCIWQSRQHAIAANSRPHHIRAMKLAAASYETYELQRYRLTKLKGETGLHITPFDQGNVGW